MNLRKYISVIGCCAVLSASAVNDGYTNQDVWSAYEGFNKTFLDSKKYIYKTDTSFPEAVDRWKGAAAIWCQPMYWDMSMNAYRLACKQGDKKRKKEFKELSRKIFEGNKAQYAGFNFHDNNENTGWFIYDDIQWWTITLARAYQLFGDDEYLKLSEASFSRVWYGSEKVGDTGSYDPKKGGMFWQWQPIQHPKPNDSDREGKMACINFPTVVAAMTLYNSVPSRQNSSVSDTRTVSGQSKRNLRLGCRESVRQANRKNSRQQTRTARTGLENPCVQSGNFHRCFCTLVQSYRR